MNRTLLTGPRHEDPDLEKVVGFCFASKDEFKNFVEKCQRKNKTLRMLNRVQWFVELADYQKYDSVRVFFLVAMAETNIKFLEDRPENNSNGGKDVKIFFEKFPGIDKEELRKYFVALKRRPGPLFFLSFKKIVEVILNVRHSLAHGKNHYDFRFNDGTDRLLNIMHGQTGTGNKKRAVRYELKITYSKFREIMVRNAVENIKSCLNNGPRKQKRGN